MGDDTFDEKILTEKLSKLNSSQQSIESLSKWCVSHRKKAKQVVKNWETIFKSALWDQRVSLLFLANDILQISRRKGSEFVTEFWKVIPAVLKGVFDKGDENFRKNAARLVGIWEERRVFGSRGQNLKNELLGNNPSPAGNLSQGKNPPPVSNGKMPNPIKVVKKDANALRLKLAVGCLPEKIVSAFQLVFDEIDYEEGALNDCRDTVSSVLEFEKDVIKASSLGDLVGSDILEDLESQENMLQKCIIKLEKSEANRVALVSQLREAIEDQESRLEEIRNEMLAARDQSEQTSNMKVQLSAAMSGEILNQPAVEILNQPAQVMSEDGGSSKKATAADIAAKLAASASSAQMLTSVLSSLVAEEAASKRPRLDNTPTSPFFSSQQPNNTPVNQLQAPFVPPLPPPRPPLMGIQYGGYGASNSANMGFVRPPPLPPLPPPQQQLHEMEQPPSSHHQSAANGGYYNNNRLPVGIGGFYGQNHPPSTPPVHRQ